MHLLIEIFSLHGKNKIRGTFSWVNHVGIKIKKGHQQSTQGSPTQEKIAHSMVAFVEVVCFNSPMNKCNVGPLHSMIVTNETYL